MQITRSHNLHIPDITPIKWCIFITHLLCRSATRLTMLTTAQNIHNIMQCYEHIEASLFRSVETLFSPSKCALAKNKQTQTRRKFKLFISQLVLFIKSRRSCVTIYPVRSVQLLCITLQFVSASIYLIYHKQMHGNK